MGTFVYTHTFRSPIDQIFAAMTDLDRLPEMVSEITAMQRVTEGPVGVGTRFRETRTMFGKDRTEEMEFTAFEPGKGYTIGCSGCGCEMSFVHRYTPEGEGTRLELECVVRPVTLLAKITTPFANAMMRGPMCKSMKKDFDEVDRHVSGPAPGAAAPA